MGYNIGYARAPNGARIAYGVAGRGPLFVWMNGSLVMSDFSKAPWKQAWLDTFTPHNTLVVYDNLGAGLSDRHPYDYSLDGLVGELDAVVQAVRATSFVLGAAAMSTPAAIRYAAGHPDRIDGLMLGLGWARGADHLGNRRFQELLLSLEDDWKLAAGTWTRVLAERGGKLATDQTEHVYGATTPRAYRDYLLAGREHDAWDYMSRIEAPTLVQHFRADSMFALSNSEALAANIPNARLELCNPATEDDPYPDLKGKARFLAELRKHFRSPGLSNGQLSAREGEVLALITTGSANAEIAARLALSEKTVARHIANIYAKLGVHNRVEAANWAREHGVG